MNVMRALCQRRLVSVEMDYDALMMSPSLSVGHCGCGSGGGGGCPPHFHE